VSAQDSTPQLCAAEIINLRDDILEAAAWTPTGHENIKTICEMALAHLSETSLKVPDGYTLVKSELFQEIARVITPEQMKSICTAEARRLLGGIDFE
jgi:hypothetical protein